jgi:hypothetical protein
MVYKFHFKISRISSFSSLFQPLFDACYVKQKTAREGRFAKELLAQAFLAFDFNFAPAFLRFKYATRRFRFCTLFDCWPIDSLLYPSALVV